MGLRESIFLCYLCKTTGEAPEYAYYKRLFEEPTEEEMLSFLRDKRLNDILG